MPHTAGHYMQDLGFGDGTVNFGPNLIVAISTGAAALTRNAAGDNAWLAPASATTTFSINLLDGIIARTGHNEDLQEAFGSTFGGGLGTVAAGPSGLSGIGIPASAGPQGRPDAFVLPGQPQPPSAMSALQPITPRTALKIKGIKPLSLAVIYKVLTGAATTLTCRLDSTTFVNGVAVAPANLLASAANGLVNVAAAPPYVTNIAIPNAIYYQITDLTQLWFELSVVEPAANTFQFYGVQMRCAFNYN